VSASPACGRENPRIRESTHTVLTFDGVRSELAKHFKLTDEEIDDALRNASSTPGFLPAIGYRRTRRKTDSQSVVRAEPQAGNAREPRQ
jgi:hypothetical protein